MKELAVLVPTWCLQLHFQLSTCLIRTTPSCVLTAWHNWYYCSRQVVAIMCTFALRSIPDRQTWSAETSPERVLLPGGYANVMILYSERLAVTRSAPSVGMIHLRTLCST